MGDPIGGHLCATSRLVEREVGGPAWGSLPARA
jgi:hypothetical protein